MGWTSKTTMGAQLTSITGTLQYFTTFPTLNPGESCLVEVECDFQATPTEGLQVYVFPTMDSGSESWDEVPYISALIPHSGLPGGTADPAKITLVVSGISKFRVGVRTSGTDTGDAATAYYMKDGVSA